MKKIIFPFVFLIFGYFFSSGQSGYLIGTSKVSLEPDDVVFSVALAGYAAPREGRFSITWEYIGEAPGIRSFTALKGKLYAVDSSNKMLTMDLGRHDTSWESTGEADGIKALAALNSELYAVNRNHELLVRKAASHNGSWKRIGQTNGITALTGLENKLYATDKNNEFLTGSPGKHNVSWKKIGHADSVLSMTGNGQRIYAIDNEDKLWYTRSYLKDIRWTEIGRLNGLGYNIQIKQIAADNNRLYAITNDGKLFKAKHNTEGNLSARALAFKSGNQVAVTVGVDVTGFNYSFIMEIKNIIYKKRHLPPECILINAAHTHFAPVTQSWLTWEDFYHNPDSIYLNKVVKTQIVKSIESALDNLSPAELYFGRGNTGIGINRSNSDKPHDTNLDVLKVQGKNGKKSSVLFLTPCHVVGASDSEHFTLSANFPGVARKMIEDKASAANTVYIQGCAGDINPKDWDYRKTGEELADDVLKLLNEKMQKISGPISCYLDTIEIPVNPWSIPQLEQFKKDNTNTKKDVDAEKNVRWADLMLGYYTNGLMPATMPIYVQTINIGNWKLVGLSREAVNEYGPAIRNIWPGKIVSVAGYCNDVSSYLPRDWHILLKTYEGYNSFFWYGQPDIFPADIFQIVTAKIKAFNR